MILMTILYFFLGFLAELGIIWLFVRNNFFQAFIYTFLINLFTWPLAQIASESVGIYLVESGVILAEGFLIMALFKIRFWRAFFISLAANAVSYGIGELLSYLF